MAEGSDDDDDEDGEDDEVGRRTTHDAGIINDERECDPVVDRDISDPDMVARLATNAGATGEGEDEDDEEEEDDSAGEAAVDEDGDCEDDADEGAVAKS